MTYTTHFVGIDISKSSFDICLLPEKKTATYANTAEGVTSFLAFLSSVEGLERLILEPPAAMSGG